MSLRLVRRPVIVVLFSRSAPVSLTLLDLLPQHGNELTEAFSLRIYPRTLCVDIAVQHPRYQKSVTRHLGSSTANQNCLCSVECHTDDALSRPSGKSVMAHLWHATVDRTTSLNCRQVPTAPDQFIITSNPVSVDRMRKRGTVWKYRKCNRVHGKPWRRLVYSLWACASFNHLM